VLITSLVALIPLLILSMFNYLQDQEAYRAESRFTVSRILSNTKRSLQFVLEERRSALSLILSERTCENLCSDEDLKNTLKSLQSTFGGFIDLGLVYEDGIQNYYAGPYDLKGKSYEDQDWFHEVILRGSFVSDVFLGHRDFPHFVIALKSEKEDGSVFILRATIDMDLVNRQIYSLELDRETDAFIINHDGVLQTDSQIYGKVLEKVNFEVPAHFRGREVVEEQTEGMNWAMFGYAYIEGSPFILVAIKRQMTPFSHWLSRRSDVIWFLAVSITLVLILIFYFTTNLVKQLRDADLKRAKAFHNVEYTNKMATIGRMAAGVAHEINNPLAIINEKAGLLKDMATFTEDFPKKEKTIKLVDSVLNSVERCAKVTHRLLGFARRMDLPQELIDLKSLLEEVVGFQTTEVAHRNINITYHIPDDMPSIESDRGQLQQVFLNLINNAIAAVPDGGEIDISVAMPVDNKTDVLIKDNGSGISPENLKHIFEPFFSTKGEFGTGLGLSITHDIVKRLGGTIDVFSELGKGTEFIITLPLKRVEIGG
jgi:signal transduction histidine kinase